MRRVVVLFLVCLGAANACAAPPTVAHLYPAGAQRGTTVEVTAGGSFEPWPVQVWACGTGVTVRPGKEKGTFSVTVAADATPGVHWLRAHNADGAAPLRPFVVGALPEIGEMEPNDEPRKAQPVAGSCVVNGRLGKPNDVDCFALTLKKGQTLVASVEANRTLKSPMDGVLQVVTPDGFVLARNNDFRGLDPQLAFPVPADGTYVVRLFAFPATPDSSIRLAGGDAYVYRLTLTTGGFADYAFPPATERGKAGSVDVIGWNVPAEARTLPVPGGHDDAATLSSPALANPLRVRPEPHPVPKELPADARPPFSVGGRVTRPGSPSIFRFTAKKGTALSVQVLANEFGLPLSPVVTLKDAAGKSVGRAEPPALHADTALSFTPAADGAYAVEVVDQYGGGGPRYAFLLRVVPDEPDYELTVAADRFTVTPGKPTPIPVKVVRKNGFAKLFVVAAESLPDGVSLKPAGGTADPAGVTLALTAEKAGLSVPFRLVGRVAGEPALTRPVRFVPAADAGEAASDLWLTVSPGPKK